jgi:hypothetical protein
LTKKDDGNLLVILSQRDRGPTLPAGPLHLPLSDSPGSAGATGALSARRRRPAPIAAALAVLTAVPALLLSGCSGRSSFLSGGPTVGQMKTSLAHLEYENAQIKRDLAKTRRENRQLEDRLVQQEQDNGELTARLDDARNLLRERGVDPSERTDPGPNGSGGFSEGSDGARTLPAGQSNRKRRQPPFVRIPGQFAPAAPDRGQSGDQEDEEGRLGPPQAAPAPANGADQVGLRVDDDLDHHSDYTGPLRWSPIAGRASAAASQVR